MALFIFSLPPCNLLAYQVSDSVRRERATARIYSRHQQILFLGRKGSPESTTDMRRNSGSCSCYHSTHRRAKCNSRNCTTRYKHQSYCNRYCYYYKIDRRRLYRNCLDKPNCSSNSFQQKPCSQSLLSRRQQQQSLQHFSLSSR